MQQGDPFVMKDPFVPSETGPAAGAVKEKAEAHVLVRQAESQVPAALMEATIRECKELREEARAERKQILADARTEADRIRADARAEADRILTKAKEYGAAIDEESQRQREDLQALSDSTAHVIEIQVKSLKGLSEVHDLLMEPKERAPTGAEVTGQTLNQLFKDLRGVAETLISKEPLLPTALAMRLGGPEVVKNIKALRAATPAPAPSEPTNVKQMVDELGTEYIAKFIEKHGVKTYSDLKPEHLQQIEADYRALKEKKDAAAAS